MENYLITKKTPSCFNHTNGSISIDDRSNNQLSFNWLNLPANANIVNGGTAVYNLGCGIYFLEIYNLDTEQTDNIEINLNCDDLLKIDFTQIEGLSCYGNNGVLNISWSGGKPPYFLTINNESAVLYDNHYSTTVINNVQYNVSIKDVNGCVTKQNNIIQYIDPLKIIVNWTPIKFHDGISETVSCNISGGVKPYEIAWFIEDSEKPIITNHTKLDNKFKHGNYKIIVKDNNGCIAKKEFTISNPSPIKVNIRNSADYASNRPHILDTIPSKVYNLVLVNKKNVDELSLDKLNNIKLTHKNIDIKQNLCMDYGETTISNQKYYYFYITPGLDSLKNSQSLITLDGKTLSLDHDTIFNSGNKLIVGSLFLSQDKSYALKKGEDIFLLSENQELKSICANFYVHNGMYFSFNVFTNVNILSSKKSTSYAKILKIINNNNDIKIKSFHNINQKHGEIYGLIYNIDTESARCEIIDENNNITTYKIHNNELYIKNLLSGKYRIKVLDDYNIAKTYNNQIVKDDYYIVDIVGSFEEEQILCQNINSQQYNIDKNLLNQYDKHLSNKILYTSPNYKNGVLINICPLDACYHITDANGDTVMEDCGYKIIDLKSGHYFIQIFKDGYISESKEFFHTKNKSIVTALLNKEINE
jgi:hypothetical protein